MHPWGRLSSPRRCFTGRRSLNPRPSYPASSPPSWLLPSLTSISGGAALFFPGPVDFAPVELLPYAIFGVVCALVGYLYVKLFYDVARDRVFQAGADSQGLETGLGGADAGRYRLFVAPGNGWRLRLGAGGPGRQDFLGDHAAAGPDENCRPPPAPSVPEAAAGSSDPRCSWGPC